MFLFLGGFVGLELEFELDLFGFCGGFLGEFVEVLITLDDWEGFFFLEKERWSL